MELQFLAELLLLSEETESEVEGKEYIDQIARMLFSTTFAGPVKDTKRSKEAKYWGVAHTKSTLTDESGKSIPLTFDNSTDSGEFEVNSLVPLNIERGSEQDNKLHSLYRKMEIPSKNKVKYIAHGDKIVVREIYLGKEITETTVRFMKHVMHILTGTSEDDEVVAKPKEEPKKEKNANKEAPAKVKKEK